MHARRYKNTDDCQYHECDAREHLDAQEYLTRKRPACFGQHKTWEFARELPEIIGEYDDTYRHENTDEHDADKRRAYRFRSMFARRSSGHIEHDALSDYQVARNHDGDLREEKHPGKVPEIIPKATDVVHQQFTTACWTSQSSHGFSIAVLAITSVFWYNI